MRYAIALWIALSGGFVGWAVMTEPPIGSAAVTAEYRECPDGAAVQTWAHRRPLCNPDGDNRLDVHYYGSDGLEHRHFRRVCRRAGGALEWQTWGREGGGHYVCRAVDF